MKFFAEIINDFQPLTISRKNSIFDVVQGSEYTSDANSLYKFICIFCVLLQIYAYIFCASKLTPSITLLTSNSKLW